MRRAGTAERCARILLALIVALIGGWLDPNELDSDSGGRRSRSLKSMVTMLTDTLGTTGAGAVVCLVGAAVLFFTLRAGGGEAKAKK